jgi:serine/threonine-protein kinase HipA
MYTDKELREVFGKPIQPVIRLDLANVSLAAQESAGKLSISGVQPKLSVRLEGEELVSSPVGGRFILKPQTSAFPQLPENEHLCMQMATQCGLHTAPNILLPLSDRSWAYVVRRFDRTTTGQKVPCEDMAQILGKTKYDGSYEQIGKAIRQHCSFPELEVQYLFERVLFCFVTGNGDAHLKNFSLLTRDDTVALSPAYDMVSSRIVIPEENEELALALNGRKNRIARRDFQTFAAALGIPPKLAEDRINAYGEHGWVMQRIGDSYLAAERQDALRQLIRERLSRLDVSLP